MIIASEQIVAAVGDAFTFRLLDLVAVKGKQRAVRIYELCGASGTPLSSDAVAYQAAFSRYFERDFAAASALLEPLTTDPPSRVLLARCRDFLHNPAAR